MAKPRLYLKEWRTFRGFTQEKLAERIGTTKASISRYEAGKQSWDDNFLEVAAVALNVTPADLVTRNPSDPESPFSIWDQVPPERRREASAAAAAVLRVFAGKTGTEG